MNHLISQFLQQPRKRILKTKHITINIKKCQACYQCVAVCPNDVLAKMNLLCHRHVRLDKPQNCTGCLACKKACTHQAIT
ncbi:4Fe-4S dicluster domain-containing protein [Desulfotomaculum sp. 1211_IL3151]|uniref:4Fe-4S dicluster domain-containing protein n=1 Tax=Desulfotomaculum sp. 1211_IL3151 TaxID=3084055 RepID=UPI003FA54842